MSFMWSWKDVPQIKDTGLEWMLDPMNAIAKELWLRQVYRSPPFFTIVEEFMVGMAAIWASLAVQHWK